MTPLSSRGPCPAKGGFFYDQCSQTLFPFEAHFPRQMAQFEGSCLITESGTLLLRQANQKINFLRRVAGCFTDYRQPERITHSLEALLAQRGWAVASYSSTAG